VGKWEGERRERRTGKWGLCSCALVLLCSCALFSPPPALAITMGIDPPTKSVHKDDIFRVSVKLSNWNVENDIQGATAYINFAPEYLRVVDAAGNQVDYLTNNFSFPLRMENLVDNNAGRIHYTAGKITLPGESAPVELVSITFKAIKKGIAIISFERGNCSVLVRIFDEIIPDIYNDGLIGIDEAILQPALGRPFNPLVDEEVQIKYELGEIPSQVIVRIYTLSGNLIRTLYGIPSTSGYAKWDGRDEQGRLVNNGVYIYQTSADYFQGTIYLKPKLIGVFKK